MVDVSKCRDLVPEKYFTSNEFEDDKDTIIEKNDLGLPVPLDLAFCRWLLMEKKVVTMPISFFMTPDSKYKNDNFIRMAICRGEKITREACENLK